MDRSNEEWRKRCRQKDREIERKRRGVERKEGERGRIDDYEGRARTIRKNLGKCEREKE